MNTQTDPVTTSLLKASIAHEQNKARKDEFNIQKQMAKRIVQLEDMVIEADRKNESLRIMLAQACDEMEGIFRTTKEFASVEIALQYTVWASYLKHNWGRDDAKCIEDANDWIEKQ